MSLEIAVDQYGAEQNSYFAYQERRTNTADRRTVSRNGAAGRRSGDYAANEARVAAESLQYRQEAEARRASRAFAVSKAVAL